MNETLERKSLGSGLYDFNDLYKEAKEIAGYDPKRKHHDTHDKMLIEAGFAPFTDESVELYKQRQVKKAKRLQNFLEAAWGYCVAVSFFGGILVGIGATIAGLAFGMIAGETIGFIWGIAVANFFTMVFIPGISLGIAFSGRKVSWSTRTIEEIDYEIPEYCLQTIVDVQKAVKNADTGIWRIRWLVDELVERKEILDPFLVLAIGEETYYMEVWNEPGFIGERKRVID